MSTRNVSERSKIWKRKRTKPEEKRSQFLLLDFVEDSFTQNIMKLFNSYIAFISAAVASVSAQNYTATDCLGGFGGLDFDISSYERYDEYFSDDSVMTLSQAGRYIGPEDIEEYVRFADTSTPEHTSFYEGAAQIAIAAPQFKGVSDDGTCQFLIILTNQYNTSATVSRASTHNTAIMFRIFYELSDNKISSINVFYSQPYLDFFFGNVLNTAPTRNFICSVLEDECSETYARNKLSTEGSNSCMLLLETLPLATGNLSYVDGYSQGCRALHAAFASQNAVHCAHISFAPEEDPKGNIKCQDSAEILISDLFDPQDLVSYDTYVKAPASLVESLDGYILISIEDEETMPPSSSPEEAKKDGAASDVLHYSLSVVTFASIAYTAFMP
jgi:hypothetical protein